MNVLVTGCAGFIGSHLCDALLEKGYNVIGVDNLSAGKPKNIPKGVVFYKVDVTDYEGIEYVFKAHKPTIVFNQMASKKTVCLDDPKKDCDVNAKGTLGLLQLSEQYGVKKFIHASTGSVYGESEEVLIESTYRNPCSYYGISKLAGENYVNLYADKINCTILRYFHVYGERQDDSDVGGVIAIFNTKIKEGKPITVFGTGKQMRLFTYVKDVVAANMAAIDYNGGIFNCASDETITLHEMIHDLAKLHKKKVKVHYADWQIGDIKNFSIDNSLIKKELGVKFTDFKNGLKNING